MDNIHRLIPTWAFPAYIFIPGVNPHPKKMGGHSFGEPEPKSEPIDPQMPEVSQFLRYSIDLFNYGYFWESHVYFEALWNAHGRKGSCADFLKGMIKLSAAGVKINIQQPVQALDHFLRAKELFESVLNAEGAVFLGFDLNELLKNLDNQIQKNEFKFSVYPIWK